MGIGTLIVFIALVLVAAIAAGVLINTAGFLQSQAEATGEESTSQVSDNIQVLTETGTVDGTPVVNTADLRVSLSPGADAIDLGNAEIQLVGPGGTETVDDGTTGVTLSGTMSDSSDRETITIDDGAGSVLDGVSSTDSSGGLDPGDEIEVTITTRNGGQASTVLVVPDPLSPDSDGAVEL